MVRNLLYLMLSPLLLVQGLYVRKVTPRLPEAAGVRRGETGVGPPLRLLILGDSAAAGVGVESQQQALAGQLAQRLAGSFRLSWQLWAANGQTSSQCLQLLELKTPEPFDAVLVSLGVNDLTGGLPLNAWLRRQSLLAERLRGTFSARHVLFTPLPPMHHFPALPQPLRWVLGERANQFNRGLQALVDACPHCHLLAFELPMRAEFIASDGFHPGAEAYALWAGQAAAVIERLMADSRRSVESRP